MSSPAWVYRHLQTGSATATLSTTSEVTNSLSQTPSGTPSPSAAATTGSQTPSEAQTGIPSATPSPSTGVCFDGELFQGCIFHFSSRQCGVFVRHSNASSLAAHSTNSTKPMVVCCLAAHTHTMKDCAARVQSEEPRFENPQECMDKPPSIPTNPGLCRHSIFFLHKMQCKFP